MASWAQACRSCSSDTSRPSEMRRILEPIAPRGAIIRADDARHTITLSGNGQDIAGMMEAISIFDVDVMHGMSFALVPVKISDPAAIADELRTVFASEQEGPMADMVQFLPNKRLGAILVISPQRNYLQRAADWVRRLDAQAARRREAVLHLCRPEPARPGAGRRPAIDVRRRYRRPRRRRAAQRGAAVPEAHVQSGGQQSPIAIVRQLRRGGNDWQRAAGDRWLKAAWAVEWADRSRACRKAPRAIAGQARPFRSAATKPPASRASSWPPTRPRTSMLIEATPADYRRIMRVIGTLDVMPNQVLLEATIAEVTLNDDLKFGVRWHLQASDKKSDYTFTDAASGAISSVFPGFSYA